VAVDAPVKLYVDPAQIEAVNAGLTLNVGNAKMVTSTGQELETTLTLFTLCVTVTRYDPLTVAEYVALVPPVDTLVQVPTLLLVLTSH
jgi:hypothetical protein